MTGRSAWALLLAACLASGQALAADAPAPAGRPSAEATQALLAAVRQRVRDTPVVRGRFAQAKTVEGFRQPLRSSGDFVVARGKGIAWQVRQPFASTLIVRPDRLLSRGADGTVGMQLRAEDEPVLRTVNAMLFAVMAADLAQLGRYFEIDGQVRGDGWTLHLVPRDALLAQWLRSVELSGQQFVQEVRLREARGDSSLIQIADPVAEPVLRAQDAALFD